jgi:CBS domain-containing protein
MTLREVLHAHVPVLSLSSTVRDAVDKMDVYQFPALVVLDGDQRPVGVLTEGDVCRSVTDLGSLTALAHEPAHRLCTPDPTVASPEMEVSDAFHQMLSQGITLLPVVEEGRFTGLVMRIDLMHAMILDSEPPL